MPTVDSTDTRECHKCIVVSCSQTRYHVVRAAAVSLGYYVEDEGRNDIPTNYHNIQLQPEAQRLSNKMQGLCRNYEASTSPQIIWLDKSVLPARVAALSCRHRINHFPGMHVIARKATLFRRLMRIRRSHELSHRLRRTLCSFPWSFAAATETPLLERFIAEMGQQSQFFILKPNKGCQGKGIMVTPEPLHVLERMPRDHRDEYLVQLYITPPLCIDRKKFDLRIYVLITSIVPGCVPRHGRRTCASPKPKEDDVYGSLNGLQLFVHSEGLVRICAEEFAAPDRTNCDQASVHLTNYAINKLVDGFSIGTVPAAGSNDCGIGEGNKRDFAFLCKYINDLSIASQAEDDEVEFSSNAVVTQWDRVLYRIDRCIMLTILSGLEELRREFVGSGASRGARSDGRNCFELLGFDIMLTEELLPVLMEVNHSPSLFCESDFDFATKHQVVMDVFRVLEPHLPSLEQCDDASYAAYQATTAACADDSSGTGFRRISPSRASSGVEWCEEDRQIFDEMLRHAVKLR
ncbi:putative Tubulin tyrosine ligase family [Trypanosoma vivax]|uniref:Tubulin-tyrosine ligase n=1 Tax=Trypanosoma vivax (strain Y486) TaxID=1055687 RepID=G0TTM4_TRYVY|nr:hypothetical protein TRVL_00088 [Trypanosoma vivax]KAH8607114.1 putative Tubulin tyrosine ligase family [Trypanosoma vivax]CCC47305.1 conserved hypothetical protein [Trypanosoma vivax Y486]